MLKWLKPNKTQPCILLPFQVHTCPWLPRGITAGGTKTFPPQMGWRNSNTTCSQEPQEKLGCVKSPGTADMMSPSSTKSLPWERITASAFVSPCWGLGSSTAERRADAADPGTQRWVPLRRMRPKGGGVGPKWEHTNLTVGSSTTKWWVHISHWGDTWSHDPKEGGYISQQEGG